MAEEKITSAKVRMYRMGTGDCFIVKFFAEETEKFTMMIDCGVWTGSKAQLTPYMEDLKMYVNGKVDLLVITHEHVDHVSVFDTCQEVFRSGFEVEKVWMAWTENDELDEVAKWKKDYGDKKKAIKVASEKLQAIVADPGFRSTTELSANGGAVLEIKERFASTLADFDALNMGVAGGGI